MLPAVLKPSHVPVQHRDVAIRKQAARVRDEALDFVRNAVRFVDCRACVQKK
jgi:hypothetical protein